MFLHGSPGLQRSLRSFGNLLHVTASSLAISTIFWAVLAASVQYEHLHRQYINYCTMSVFETMASLTTISD